MYRTIDCTIWQDAWMQTLSPEASYLFIYLFTNHRATACGVYELTPGMMARETRLSPSAVTAALAELAPKVCYWPDLDVVWVVNFYKRQQATSNTKFTASARRTLAQFPAEVQAAVWAQYPTLNPTATPPPPATNPPGHGMGNGIPDGISSPIPNKDNSEQITVNSEHAGASAAAQDAADPEWDAIGHSRHRDQVVPAPVVMKRLDAAQALAATLCATYPRRLGVAADCEDAVSGLMAADAGDWEHLPAAVAFYATHEDAKKENGRYVMGIGRFIGGQWKRYIPPAVVAAPPRRAAWLVESDARRAEKAARLAAAATGKELSA